MNRGVRGRVSVKEGMNEEMIRMSEETLNV